MTDPTVHRDSRAASLISVGAHAIIENAKRLGLQWGIAPATVQQASVSTGFVQIIMDGDTTPIQAMSLVGSLLPGWRVMVLSVPPSANFIVGSFVQTSGMVGYGSRTTNPSASTTETAVLELDNVHVKAGVAYRIGTSSLLADSTVANDSIRINIRYTTDGTTPTTADTLMTSMEQTIGALASQIRGPMNVIYQPTTDQVLNLILTQARSAGTGSIALQHITGMPIDIYVEAVGVATPDLGAAL